MFEVTFNPATGTSTWVNRSYDWGDLPVTDLVADSNGDLYASSDFGVSRLVAGTTTWTRAGTAMPNVEVAGLTIVPGSGASTPRATGSAPGSCACRSAAFQRRGRAAPEAALPSAGLYSQGDIEIAPT